MVPSNLPDKAHSGDAPYRVKPATVTTIFQPSPSITLTGVSLLKEHSVGHKQLGETGQNMSLSSFLKLDSSPKGELRRSGSTVYPPNFTLHGTDKDSFTVRYASLHKARRASRPKVKTGCNNCK
jgi:hypothetical protein